MIRQFHPEPLSYLSPHIGAPCDAVANTVTLGVDEIDCRIAGGLMRRALHEVFAVSVDDGSTAAGFALMVAVRASLGGHPIIWVRERRNGQHVGHLHAAGLVELGFDPDDLVLIDAPDTLAVLRAGSDIVKCGQVGTVVIEPWEKAPLLDLTASRRLSMSAAASGVLTLLLRVNAEPMPSAAQTRWQVASAPSSPLAANAPGNPALDITLLRHRGGIAGFEARLEWNRDTRSFASISRSVPAVPSLGADKAHPSNQRRAA